jgi:hypothetical protein
MADFEKCPDEKLDTDRTFYPTDDSTFTLPSKEFAPISNGPSKANSRSNSHTRGSGSMRSISRTRSHNGYGCDDNEENTEDIGDLEVGNVVDKDPFEVHWEGGDEDEMNPRSMGLARKWLVVIIVSASSLCV